MLLEDFLGKNIVGRTEVLSFTGKANHAAGLLFAMRPFMQQLYGALHSASDSARKDSKIWTKQIRHSLMWLRAFLKGEITGNRHRCVAAWHRGVVGYERRHLALLSRPHNA